MKLTKESRLAGLRRNCAIPAPKRQRTGARQDASRGSEADAFTLIEVMLAITIFFMAMFAILNVLTSGVRAATLLRNNGPTAGMVLAQLSTTNKLYEGSDSGTFKDVPIYEGYRWVTNIREVATNGLFQVDAVVADKNGNQVSVLSVLLYKPDSDTGKMGLQTPR